MDIREWWTRLPEPAKAWLIDNNGSPVPADIAESIRLAGGPSTGELEDGDVDWIEAVANGEE